MFLDFPNGVRVRHRN